MKIGREGSVFIIAMFIVAFLNGSIGTWFSMWIYVFVFLAVLSVLAKFISKHSSKDAATIAQVKNMLKGQKPEDISNLSLGNTKEVHKVWKDLPQAHFKDKEREFNQAINADSAPTTFAVANKALYEAKRKRGPFQKRVTRDDILRPLRPEEVESYKAFSAQAQQILIDRTA